MAVPAEQIPDERDQEIVKLTNRIDQLETIVCGLLDELTQLKEKTDPDLALAKQTKQKTADSDRMLEELYKIQRAQQASRSGYLGQLVHTQPMPAGQLVPWPTTSSTTTVTPFSNTGTVSNVTNHTKGGPGRAPPTPQASSSGLLVGPLSSLFGR